MCGNCWFRTVLILLNLQCGHLQILTTVSKNVTKIETTTLPTIISTSLSTAACNANQSCFTNSTSVATTASSKPTNSANATSVNGSTEPPPKISPFKSRKTSRSEKEICICDLKIDYCDINCCCDKDCTFENKLVFSHCEEDFHHYDTRYCQYTKHVYINNTHHELEVKQNGLFCVVVNNVPPTYIIQQKHPLKTFQDAEFQKIDKYSWPQQLPEQARVPELNYDNYTYGKPLWIIHNNHLQTLQYSKSFVVPQCIIKEEIKYLNNIKSSCSYTDISEDQNLLHAEEYYTNVSIVRNPGLLNASLYKKNHFVQKCPRTACLTAVPKICDKYFENCTLLNKNSTNLHKLKCHLSISENKLFCTNLVQHVKYNFYHNGTGGIVKAELFMNLVNVSYTFGKNFEFFQTFEVNFLWWNNTLNYSSYLSGNPGYLVGKPILLANMIFVNATSRTTNTSTNGTYLEPQLFRNPLDFTSNFMVLPHVNSDGNCVLNKNQYTPIEFGFNYYLKCTVKETIQYKNMSAKNVCIEIQRSIFKYWSLNVTNNTLNNRLIGQFGNAYIHNLDEWVKVMFKDDIHDILNRTWGKFENNALMCGNITTLLITEVFHTRIDFDNILNQDKILATTVQFDNLKNIVLPFNKKNTQIQFSVKVNMQIAFFDITSKKIRKIVDPPSLNIRLPHDFFYPFVKLNNKALTQTVYVELFLICLMFVNIAT